MCGINGIFAYHYAANPVDRRELIRTRDAMIARGPDGAGEWFSGDGRVGLGHRRLAIIDLSEAGAQPMSSADGRLVVTFNGEIYNYQKLRRDLEAKGYVFRSNSDTEVLLHLFADRGAAMVQDLRGMFAFAIWDTRSREVFLARDPYGIKPLYYVDDGWTFRFASQVKSLISGGGVSKDPEPAGVVGFYLWGSVPEPFTSYQAVRALPAGCTLSVSKTGADAPTRYHSIGEAYLDAERLLGGRTDRLRKTEELRAALLDSTRQHLVADVPVGAFLSAGVDSGALVGLMRDAGQQDIQTVTLAFEEFRGAQHDEAPLAELVARHYGTRHVTRVVTRSEFEVDLPLILDAMDQPSIDGINVWFVSKAAREQGLKVAISGLGGDELFGGYPSFRDLPKWVRYMRGPSLVPGLGRLVRKVGQPMAQLLGLGAKFPGILEYGGTYAGAYLLRRGLFMPWELNALVAKDVLRAGLQRLHPLGLVNEQLQCRPKGAHGIVSTLESSLYMRNQLLRDTDWASMAHSLEVRVPLVDSVLLNAVSKFAPCGVALDGKALLADAPTRPLPTQVVGRQKTGFVTPVDAWMQSGLGRPRPLSGAALPRRRSRSWARDWGIKVAATTLTRDLVLPAAASSREPKCAS